MTVKAETSLAAALLRRSAHRSAAVPPPPLQLQQRRADLRMLLTDVAMTRTRAPPCHPECPNARRLLPSMQLCAEHYSRQCPNAPLSSSEQRPSTPPAFDLLYNAYLELRKLETAGNQRAQCSNSHFYLSHREARGSLLQEMHSSLIGVSNNGSATVAQWLALLELAAKELRHYGMRQVERSYARPNVQSVPLGSLLLTCTEKVSQLLDGGDALLVLRTTKRYSGASLFLDIAEFASGQRTETEGHGLWKSSVVPTSSWGEEIVSSVAACIDLVEVMIQSQESTKSAAQIFRNFYESTLCRKLFQTIEPRADADGNFGSVWRAISLGYMVRALAEHSALQGDVSAVDAIVAMTQNSDDPTIDLRRYLRDDDTKFVQSMRSLATIHADHNRDPFKRTFDAKSWATATQFGHLPTSCCLTVVELAALLREAGVVSSADCYVDGPQMSSRTRSHHMSHVAMHEIVLSPSAVWKVSIRLEPPQRRALLLLCLRTLLRKDLMPRKQAVTRTDMVLCLSAARYAATSAAEQGRQCAACLSPEDIAALLQAFRSTFAVGEGGVSDFQGPAEPLLRVAAQHLLCLADYFGFPNLGTHETLYTHCARIALTAFCDRPTAHDNASDEVEGLWSSNASDDITRVIRSLALTILSKGIWNCPEGGTLLERAEPLLCHPSVWESKSKGDVSPIISLHEVLLCIQTRRTETPLSNEDQFTPTDCRILWRWLSRCMVVDVRPQKDDTIEALVHDYICRVVAEVAPEVWAAAKEITHHGNVVSLSTPVASILLSPRWEAALSAFAAASPRTQRETATHAIRVVLQLDQPMDPQKGRWLLRTALDGSQCGGPLGNTRLAAVRVALEAIGEKCLTTGQWSVALACHSAASEHKSYQSQFSKASPTFQRLLHQLVRMSNQKASSVRAVAEIARSVKRGQWHKAVATFASHHCDSSALRAKCRAPIRIDDVECPERRQECTTRSTDDNDESAFPAELQHAIHAVRYSALRVALAAPGASSREKSSAIEGSSMMMTWAEAIAALPTASDSPKSPLSWTQEEIRLLRGVTEGFALRVPTTSTMYPDVLARRPVSLFSTTLHNTKPGGTVFPVAMEKGPRGATVNNITSQRRLADQLMQQWEAAGEWERCLELYTESLTAFKWSSFPSHLAHRVVKSCVANGRWNEAIAAYEAAAVALSNEGKKVSSKTTMLTLEACYDGGMWETAASIFARSVKGIHQTQIAQKSCGTAAGRGLFLSLPSKEVRPTPPQRALRLSAAVPSQQCLATLQTLLACGATAVAFTVASIVCRMSSEGVQDPHLLDYVMEALVANKKWGDAVDTFYVAVVNGVRVREHSIDHALVACSAIEANNSASSAGSFARTVGAIAEALEDLCRVTGAVLDHVALVWHKTGGVSSTVDFHF